MDSIAAFPFRVEVWDMNDVGIDEVLAYCRNVTVARGAYAWRQLARLSSRARSHFRRVASSA
jgi:hypothetical protein